MPRAEHDVEGLLEYLFEGVVLPDLGRVSHLVSRVCDGGEASGRRK